MGLAWDPTAVFKTLKKNTEPLRNYLRIYSKGCPSQNDIYDYCGILWCLMANHCCNVDNFIAVSFLINSASTMASEHTAYIYVMIIVKYFIISIIYYYALLSLLSYAIPVSY